MNLRPICELATAWCDEASGLRRRGLEREARMIESCAEALRNRLHECATHALTVGDAAEESGYSERRLRELLSEGKLPNVGKPGAPRIRRQHLPAKPGSESPSLEIANGGSSLADEALTRRQS